MSKLPPDSPDCTPKRRLLAAGPIASVEACDCGVVHVNLGAISFRFTHDGLDAFQRTLAQASCALTMQQHEESFRFIAQRCGGEA